MYPLEVYSASSVVGRGDIRPVGRRGQPQPPILGPLYHTIPYRNHYTIPTPQASAIPYHTICALYPTHTQLASYIHTWTTISTVQCPNASIWTPNYTLILRVWYICILPMQMYSNPNHSDNGAVNNSETSKCIDTVEPLVFRGNLGVFRYISISDDVKIKANMILKIQSCRILWLKS